MLEAVIADGGRSSVSDIARQIDMPVATAHRQVLTLVETGFLAPSGRGRHVAGGRLLTMAHRLDEKQAIVNIAASFIHRLAVQVRCTVQLGTYENEMVTYRIKAGRGSKSLFTRVGMQLEAYCSGIGKVLLAHLHDEEREAYLAAGPFVPLTQNTITDPAALRDELVLVRTRGYAFDDGEVALDIRCLAVPIRRRDGTAPAAISASQIATDRHRLPDEQLLPLMLETARQIEQRAFG